MIKTHLLKKITLLCFFIASPIAAMQRPPYEISSEHKAHGITQLHYAALIGSVETTKLLLDQGYAIDVRTKDDSTPLIFAAHSGHVAVVELLIKRGANKEASTVDGTALHLAVRNEHVAVVEKLLALGSNTEAKDQAGLTPINLAARLGNKTIVLLLLQKRKKNETVKIYGILPLAEAAGNGKLEVVKSLIEAGVCNEAHEVLEGYTPLHCAARHCQTPVCVYLIGLLRKAPTKEEAKRVRARFHTALLCFNRIYPLGLPQELKEIIFLSTSGLVQDTTTLMLYDLNEGRVVWGSLLAHPICRELAAEAILQHSTPLLNEAYRAVKDAQSDTKSLLAPANRKTHILPIIKASIDAQIDKNSQVVETGKQKLQAQTCDHCKKSGKLSRCGKCKSVFYCSSACQKQAWPEHKKVCNTKGK